MDYFPLFLDIKDRSCMVVGGGEVAARKVALLQKANAEVTVVSPELCETLKEWSRHGLIFHAAKRFEAADLTDQALVVAATDDSDVNRAVSEAAKAKNIPVNVVDNPALCTFVMPSIVDRSPVVIAVSSGGASPVLSRLVRARLETLVPAAYGRLATLMGRYRSAVKARFKTVSERRQFWEKTLQGPIAEHVFAGQDHQAEVDLQREIAREDALDHDTTVGEVYLVGAGPGDPDLLTFRALRLMQQADVIVYDRLVSPEVLELARRDAERIYAGKERDNHAIPQGEINHLLVRLAKEGKRVCRLKGGDPFIFGRGGEELDLLLEEKIPFQVVPGITAASGCAAYAGIPLTHRDCSQSVSFVTGHLKDGTVNLHWDGLIQPRNTIVIYMGLVAMEPLCRELIAHGLSHDTPVALVQQGTTQHQRVYEGTLGTMPDVVRAQEIQAPTLIIVGQVVKLRSKLNWFQPTE